LVTDRWEATMRVSRGITLGLALALLGAAPAAAQTGHDLFQQALVKERADGDLRGAIAIYERIAREFPQDHALAARSLLQMGRCHEKLGSQDAQRVYRRLVQEYPDQTEMAQEARARLAALAASPATPRRPAGAEAGITMREIRFDGLEDAPFAMLSPDETRVVYVHVRQAAPRFSLRVRTLASNADAVLVDSVANASVFCQWSPDGSRVAYANLERELRVVDAAGGSPRVVWSSPAGTRVIPLDWTPGGDRILVAVRNMAAWSHELVLVSLSGTAQSLRSGSLYALLDYGQFSPDGAFIAGIQRGDVYVWSVDGREETRVTTDPADEEWPFWSPDGRFLVFSSERSGEKDLWVVPMERGAPTGPAVRVKAGLGRRAVTSAMTASGGLQVVTYGEGSPDDLFVLSVDPAASEPAGGFRTVARYPTQHFQPRWSPDGARLAYTSRKGEIGWPRIFVGLGASQQDVELPTRDHYPANVEWGRDGTSLLFPGFRRQDGRVGIFRLSLDGSTIEPLHLGDPPGPGFRGAFVNLVWLPAAGRYFLQQVGDPARMDFYAMDADGSGLRRTASAVATNYWAWPSPDGRRVAYRDERSLHVMALDGQVSRLLAEWQDTVWFDVAPGWSPDGRRVAWTDRAALRVLDTADGTARLLTAAPAGSQIVAPPVWAPSGLHVAYVVRDTATGASSRRDEVWLVPSEGGSARRIAVAPESHPRLHLETWLSDGTLAVGGSPRPGVTGGYRHWVLEGFLPYVAGGRRR
jgi:Tol biopolymer transport system component